jgi:hypothetical protein
MILIYVFIKIFFVNILICNLMFVLNITIYCICGKKNDCFKYFNPKPQTDSTGSFWYRIDLKFLFNA